MIKHFYYFVSLFIIPAVILSCSSSCKVNHSKKTNTDNKQTGGGNLASPPVIVYKTKADYFDKVPVTLSDDKSEIVSYPGIKDVFKNGELAYPTKLNEGYLLDNRGIGPNSAFLKLTYEEYGKLETLPAKEELNELIIDRDPFTKMYNCGSIYSFNDIVNELNELIDSGKLKKQTRLK